MAELPTYDPTTPAIAQNDDWSCGPTTTRWMLLSVGRHPSESWIETTMIEEGVVSQDIGILDKSGAGLADFVTRHYGYATGYNGYNASFDALAMVAGERPYGMSGGAWYHWSGLRGYDEITDCLLLANPAPGWKGIRQTMTRAEFAQLGPWSYFWIDAQLTSAGVPTTPPDDLYAVGAGIRQQMAADGTYPASDEIYLKHGATDAMSFCSAADGSLYTYIVALGQVVRYRPAA